MGLNTPLRYNRGFDARESDLLRSSTIIGARDIHLFLEISEFLEDVLNILHRDLYIIYCSTNLNFLLLWIKCNSGDLPVDEDNDEQRSCFLKILKGNLCSF